MFVGKCEQVDRLDGLSAVAGPSDEDADGLFVQNSEGIMRPVIVSGRVQFLWGSERDALRTI